MTPETLATLHLAAFEDSRSWSEQEFAELLASPFCFVVGDQDGFAIGRVIADEAELLTIATHPSKRRAGVGARSLSGFQTEAANRGGKSAFLEVAEDNAAAIALYESAGWSKAACRKGYYTRLSGNRVDALILTRPLP